AIKAQLPGATPNKSGMSTLTTSPAVADTLRRVAPVSFGVVGAGGYAGVVCDHLLSGSAAPHPVVRLSGVYEPNQPAHRHRLSKLQPAGTQTFNRFEDLLASDIEAIWLPLPIHLHAPFAEKALSAGKAVMCEKPAAGCIDDVDRMICIREQFQKPLLIGFQH